MRIHRFRALIVCVSMYIFVGIAAIYGCSDEHIEKMPTADYTLNGVVLDQISSEGVSSVIVRFAEAPIGTTSSDGTWSIEGREMPYCPLPEDETCGVYFYFPSSTSYRDTIYIPDWTQAEFGVDEYKGHFVAQGIEILVEP